MPTTDGSVDVKSLILWKSRHNFGMHFYIAALCWVLSSLPETCSDGKAESRTFCQPTSHTGGSAVWPRWLLIVADWRGC